MPDEDRFCSKCGTRIPQGSGFCPNCGTPVSGGPSESAEAPVSGFATLTKDTASQSYWVKRIVAFVVDAVIVYVALAFLALFLVLPVLLVWGPDAFGVAIGGVFSVASGVALFLYFLFAEMSMGSSVGKRIMRLKVLGPGGRSPNPGEVAIRNVSKVYWLLLLLDVVVGLAVSKQYTQKYSDRLAGTSVVSY